MSVEKSAWGRDVYSKDAFAESARCSQKHGVPMMVVTGEASQGSCLPQEESKDSGEI